MRGPSPRPAALALALLAGVCLPALAVAQEVPALAPTASASSQATRDTATAQATSSAAPSDAPASQSPGQGAAMTVPKTMPPMIRLNSPDRPLSHKAAASVTVATRWRNRFTRPAVDRDGVERFTYGVGEPTVACAMAHVCDIALQPGEQVSGPPHIGDQRWWVSPAVSGSGRTRTVHVLVKPIDAGMDTNIVLQTDRRTYSIQLVSTVSQYMPLVAFNYPNDDTQAAADWASLAARQDGGGAPCDQPPSIPPSAYRITAKAGNPRWLPVQAYAVSTAVGTKTCIEFPSDIGSASLPALVALGNDGSWFGEPSKVIMNFHYTKRRFVVDDLLDRAELVNGIDGNRELVKITRIETLMRKITPLPLVGLLLVSGCAGGLQSYISTITPDDAKTVGAGIVSFVQTRDSPASGAIALEGPANDGLLAPEIQTELEAAGYKVSAGDARHHLRYQVTGLDNGLLVRLSLDDGDAARFYQRDFGKLSPSGPFTFREASR